VSDIMVVVEPEGDLVIDLRPVKAVMREVDALIDALHGQDLDETAAVTHQTKNRSRQERAQMSQHLNLLASRLELAAQLVRNEYWVARGEADPLNPRR
jgi:hypothetical protein